MFGVLVDVSGSMQNAFALGSDKDASVERAHAIITSILNIVSSEVNRHEREDEIFVSAFGLSVAGNICDLIALLDIIAGPRELKGKNGHDALVALACKHNYSHAERWIREHLTRQEAQDLFRILCFDESLIPKLVEKLPSRFSPSRGLAGMASYVSHSMEGRAIHNSEAYCFAEELMRDKQKIISRVLSKIKLSRPRSVQFVSKLLNDLNLRDHHSYRHSLHGHIRELLFEIEPYIYGGTPMCEAMKKTLDIFRASCAKSKVLFILSDGQSGDGNPRHVADALKRLGVTIVTCYLTDSHIANPKCLFYEAPSHLSSGALTMLEMSSTMRNIDPPVSYLIDAKWKLPESGECRLFVQANSLEIVDELCKVVVSQLANPCDALIDLLNKVDVADYINSKNAEFEPGEQDKNTCYANAVAAVIHLAMHRIVKREGGHPNFKTLRDERIIPEFGKDGANTRRVLEKVCPEYRLHFKEVDELHARQALNQRRPLVARFSLFDKQWHHFNKFFDRNPKGILKKCDIEADTDGQTKSFGHAVVLIRCTPECLVFMNSRGTNWGDGGFFRVKDASVLNNVKFFDVYWTENDLTQAEKEAYELEAIKYTRYLDQKYPSVNELLFQCPLCKRNSKVGRFEGHLLEAKCPRCEGVFKPKVGDLAKTLYLKSL